MFKARKPPPDARILKLRNYEDKLQSMQAKCKEQAAFGMVAGWEAATDQKIAHNAVMREFGALRTQQQETLDSRRQALAQKLYAEEAALQRELAQCAATPEEKRAALAERAQSLWEAREAERQATANALLERHFRENSDQLRALFSQKTAQATLAARQRQVEDNTARRINALHEKTAWDECEAFEGLKATMQGAAAAQKRADDKTNTDRQLGEQLRAKARRTAEEAARERAELERVAAAQAAAAAAADAREAAAAAARKELADSIRAYNEAKLLDDRRRSAEEVAAERAWMADFLARERAQVQAEAALAARKREELRLWLETLKHSSKAEALDQAEMERMVEAYQREQWARYDAKQAALAEARRALQREVHEARQHQIADKAAARAAAAAEDAAARQRLAEEGARTAELEAAARARAAADALRQRLDLQGERAVQAAYDEQRRRVEGQEKARELELAREQEAAYLERVRAAGEHTPPAHFGRPKVQWFY